MYGILPPHACARENEKRNVTKKAFRISASRVYHWAFDQGIGGDEVSRY
jgi:hypothetical protein